MTAGRTAVYRLFDASDRLLYVGEGKDPDVRRRAHGRRKWGGQIARMTVEWHPTRDDALAVELQAIRSENPAYNEAGVPYDYAVSRGVPGDEEWLSLSDIAKRVVELGYAKSMTRQRVWQLAQTDPAWPVPQEAWRVIGQIKLLPWRKVEEYFKNRDNRSGPKGWSRAE